MRGSCHEQNSVPAKRHCTRARWECRKRLVQLIFPRDHALRKQEACHVEYSRGRWVRRACHRRARSIPALGSKGAGPVIRETRHVTRPECFRRRTPIPRTRLRAKFRRPTKKPRPWLSDVPAFSVHWTRIRIAGAASSPQPVTTAIDGRTGTRPSRHREGKTVECLHIQITGYEAGCRLKIIRSCGHVRACRRKNMMNKHNLPSKEPRPSWRVFQAGRSDHRRQ